MTKLKELSLWRLQIDKIFFLAAELGNENKTTDDDRLNFTTKVLILKQVLITMHMKTGWTWKMDYFHRNAIWFQYF
jgi:hypothetical protein